VNRDRAIGWFGIGFGLVLLYAAWANVSGLNPPFPMCEKIGSKGLHLGEKSGDRVQQRLYATQIRVRELPLHHDFRARAPWLRNSRRATPLKRWFSRDSTGFWSLVQE
jgi:hypothetical protein